MITDLSPEPTATPLLAFFLRYPNPFARHVLSVDVLSRRIDPQTGQLHTTRLILKRGILPKWANQWLPVAGASGGRGLDAWVLEESVVDPPDWGDPSSVASTSIHSPFTTSVSQLSSSISSSPSLSQSSSSSTPTPTTETLSQSTTPSSTYQYVSSYEDQRTGSVLETAEEEEHSRRQPRLRVVQGNLNHRKFMHVIEGGEIVAGPNGSTLHHTTAEIRSNFGGAWSNLVRQRIESYGIGKFEVNTETARKGMALILDLLRRREPLPGREEVDDEEGK
ncbi:hypothetical protein M231_00295 [Tremella mesenterica]|uniref:PRELI/MSF1 domain-containing protein n=1 Tax=Tremella mesenterica TaxID=5217 RepID=A0A4Q1BVY5_TREME|nr:hypothetical protein M231_00295 [Tremella mesenterica]